MAQSWYFASLIVNLMGIESAVYETITVWGVKRGGTVFYTHCHKSISDGIADHLVDRLKVNLYKWIMQILFSHCKNHQKTIWGEIDLPDKKWECSKTIGERLEEQQNLQLNVHNPLSRVSVCPTGGMGQGCGHGGRHQSESRHTALQRGLCKLWCPKNVANIIIMWNENTLCPQILLFKKNGSENYYYQKISVPQNWNVKFYCSCS